MIVGMIVNDLYASTARIVSTETLESASRKVLCVHMHHTVVPESLGTPDHFQDFPS